MSYDREETYPIIDKYFDNEANINSVVIQLGENVKDADIVGNTFELDYRNLLVHIKLKAPNAKIVAIGEFWTDQVKNEIKKRVAMEENVSFVDLSEIWNDPSYMAGMQTIVEGDDGEKHIIEHKGVASHPGDKGMKYIADRVVEAIIK